MPQKKRVIQFFGISRALLCHPEVGKFARENTGVFMGREEFLTLIEASENPRFFANPTRKRFSLFARIYERQPDDVLEFMCLIRKILKKWETTQAGRAMKFFCEHRIIQVDKRRGEANKYGQSIAIIIKSLFDNSEKRISVVGWPAEKIHEHLYPKHVAWEFLEDKELAVLLKVNVESVKKARQEISRIDRDITFWENPAVVKYMQEGIMTPEYLSVCADYAKGKK